MKKKLLFAAIALTAMASCTEDSFVGEQSQQEANASEGAISFNLNTSAVTRGDKTGSDAAGDLNNLFYVWGIKNEGGTSGNGIADASTGNLVYNNYVVKWTDNSQMTSTSNTEGWEYVGYTLSAAEAACITTNSGSTVSQTIKYWDFGAYDYTFYAFSADPADLNATLSSAKVKVAKTKSATSPKTVYDKGYAVTLETGANLDKLYFSERVNIPASANTERRLDNTYGGNVTFRFHNGSTKVRVAMYETIPGYSVTIDKFLVDNDGTDPTFVAMDDEVTANFAANLQNSKKGDAGTLTVTYNSEAGATQNWPILSFVPASGNKNKVLALGDGLKATIVLGTSITGATYDKEDNLSTTGIDESYTSVFPNETNSQNLKLKVNYTLTAVDNSGNATTGETIKIEGATAEIPAAYLKWKPGFAYTYIFKISDNTNGSTGTPGTNPTGLYPITFDAVEMVDADGLAEYITTVSEPSITTFGVNANKYVTGGSDYAAGTAVYATVMDGSSLATLSESNFSIYDVTTSDVTNFPVTEASVAEALIEGPTWTAAQAALKKITCADGPTLTFQKTVPAEDGTTKTLDAGNNKAATFTTATGKKYAIVYQKTAATYTTDGGKNDYTSETFTAAGTLYTDASCTTKAESWTSGTTYYKRTAVSSKGEYVVKIVTCP